VKNTFRPGIDTLLSRHRKWLRGKRVGLVSHVAATDLRGCTSAERLWRCEDVALACLFGPEHGFFGLAGAGEECRSKKHPGWGIPVFSLYGRTRKPDSRMFRGIDTLVFDLQDIGARPYTYVSTLKLCLEAASETSKDVIVADRPIPLPCTVDGPVTVQGRESFVSAAGLPISYGMTPGETATWFRESMGLDLDLKVARMRGYARQAGREAGWPPWIPPSPAIRSWESARCYPATVFCEGLPSIDCGRATNLPFQLLGAKWMKGARVAAALSGLNLPGVAFYPHRYDSRPGRNGSATLDGVRLVVTDSHRFKPIFTAVSIISCLQKLYGMKRIWNARGARPRFFDLLFGTSEVREALLDGDDGGMIASRWRRPLSEFGATRKACLLYETR